MYTLEKIRSFFPSADIIGIGEKATTFDADELFVMYQGKCVAQFEAYDDEYKFHNVLNLRDPINQIGCDVNSIFSDLMDGGLAMDYVARATHFKDADTITELNIFYAAVHCIDSGYPCCLSAFLDKNDIEEAIYDLHECRECFEDGYCDELAEKLRHITPIRYRVCTRTYKDDVEIRSSSSFHDDFYEAEKKMKSKVQKVMDDFVGLQNSITYRVDLCSDDPNRMHEFRRVEVK